MTLPSAATVMVPMALPPASVMGVAVPSVSASGVPSPFVSMVAEAMVIVSPSASLRLASTLTGPAVVSSVTETGSAVPVGASLTGTTVTLAVAVLEVRPPASVTVKAKARAPAVGSWLVFS